MCAVGRVCVCFGSLLNVCVVDCVCVCCWLCMCAVENLKVLIKHAMKGNQQCYEWVREIWDKGKKSNRPKGGYHYRHAGLASAAAKLLEDGKLRQSKFWQGSKKSKEDAMAKYKGHNITMLKDKLWHMEKSNQLMIKSIELLVVFSLFAFDYL